MPDQVKEAYRKSRNVYDSILQQKNPFSRLYAKLFWSGTDDVKVAEKLLSWIPDDFDGRILDVPCGTAVFTEEKWKKMKQASILCLDYSMDMLAKAENRFAGYSHITCMQGDVGNLPAEDASMDFVVSMNGFHAFPDKEKALQEITRVLKSGGILIACFYIRGKAGITDWLVRHILSSKGWFTPPFFDEKEVREKLEGSYQDVHLECDGSILLVHCKK